MKIFSSKAVLEKKPPKWNIPVFTLEIFTDNGIVTENHDNNL